AGVVGAMPNIPANRLNSQLDLGAPSFTVAAEELSGLRALEIAWRALEHGEIDVALVGAVDLCAEPVHEAAAASVLGAAHAARGPVSATMRAMHRGKPSARAPRSWRSRRWAASGPRCGSRNIRMPAGARWRSPTRAFRFRRRTSSRRCGLRSGGRLRRC